MLPVLILLSMVPVLTVGQSVGAGTGGIGLTDAILPTGYFQPKWVYNQSTIVYPFGVELNNPYVCKTGTNMYGSVPAGVYVAVLSLGPCNYITEHYHPEAYEYNYVLTGNLDYWIVLGNGTITYGYTPVQNLMLMPMGLTHTILNDNCGVTSFFHRFAVANPIFSFTVPSVETMPSRFKTSSFVGGKLPAAIIPDGIHTLDVSCLKRCGLSAADFSSTGKYGDGLCSHLDPMFS